MFVCCLYGLRVFDVKTNAPLLSIMENNHFNQPSLNGVIIAIVQFQEQKSLRNACMIPERFKYKYEQIKFTRKVKAIIIIIAPKPRRGWRLCVKWKRAVQKTSQTNKQICFSIKYMNKCVREGKLVKNRDKRYFGLKRICTCNRITGAYLSII